MAKLYWTFERCQEEASKCKSKVEFMENCRGGYNASIRNKWIGKICGHMGVGDVRPKRCIYAVEFPDNHVYVGLTFNIEDRFGDHIRDVHYNKSKVLLHIKETGLIPIIKQLTEYIDVKDAPTLEVEMEKKYRNGGWIILNKAKCGGIGGKVIKWTKDKCIEEALKYKTRYEFAKSNPGCYQAVVSNQWLEDVCGHMTSKEWTYERCQIEALKYKTRSEYKISCSASYERARKEKWLNKICGHMRIKKIKKRGYWTFDKIMNLISLYETRYELYKNERSAWDFASKSDWLDILYPDTKVTIKWDLEKIKTESKKYKTRGEFNKLCTSGYQYAWKYHLLDELYPDTRSTWHRWSIEKVKVESLKYETKSGLRKGSPSAYQYAYSYNLLDELYPKIEIKWTFDELKEEVMKHDTRTKLKKESGSAYYYAQKYNLLDELYPETKRLPKAAA